MVVEMSPGASAGHAYLPSAAEVACPKVASEPWLPQRIRQSSRPHAQAATTV